MSCWLLNGRDGDGSQLRMLRDLQLLNVISWNWPLKGADALGDVTELCRNSVECAWQLRSAPPGSASQEVELICCGHYVARQLAIGAFDLDLHGESHAVLRGSRFGHPLTLSDVLSPRFRPLLPLPSSQAAIPHG
jgi:hypothetical protein